MDYFESDSNLSFHELLVGDEAYIDKTGRIAELYRDHDTFELLVRPLGFGKTVTLETIYHIFTNQDEELLEKLEYKNSDVVFPEHLVIKIDFSKNLIKSAKDLETLLFTNFRNKSFEFNLDHRVNRSLSIYHQTVDFIKAFAQKSPTQKIVILIDNYDYPILNNLFSNYLNEINNSLMLFYKALEDCETLIDWCLITGETKFFFCYENNEGLNYVNDVSYSERSTTLCGFTPGEMKKYYQDFIQDQADILEQTVDVFLGNLNDWYGNFRFTSHNIKVMRPSSIKSYLSQRDQNQFKVYYPYDHVSKFLPRLLKKYGKNHERFLTPNDSGYNFCDYNSIDNIKMFALLSQLGFYTFTHIDMQISEKMQKYAYFSNYTNKEMREIYAICLNESQTIKDF